MHGVRKGLLAFCAAALVASPAVAQEPGRTAAVSDTLFVAAAGDSGLAEVSMSQLGVQRATNAELKEFSQQMINEHTQLNQQLAAVAAQKGMPVPRVTDARAQFCAQNLAGLTGEKFDQCYAKAQLVAHMEAVSAFEAESERGQDSDIKALAAKTLPRLKKHLAMIEPIANRLKGNERTTAER